MEFSVTPAYEPGIYRAKLVSIEAGTRNNFDTGEPEACREWTFKLLEEGFEGGEVQARTSMAFGPRSNARKWIEALLGGRKLQAGDKTTSDELAGREVDIVLETTESGYSKVAEVHPVRRKGRATEQSEFAAAREAVKGTQQPVAAGARGDDLTREEIDEIAFD